MESEFLEVLKFEQECGVKLANRGPSAPDLKTVELRIKLVKEESGELLDALEAVRSAIIAGDPITDEMIAEVADGSADTKWVCHGTDVAFAIDGPAVFREVDRSNDTKFGPDSWIREDGKRMKGASYSPADILGVLASQRPLAETYGDQEEMAKWAAFVLSGYQFSNIARWESLFRAGSAEWMVRGYEGGGAYRTLDVADACREARKLDVKTEAK